MHKWITTVFMVLLSITLAAQVVNYEAEGNLKSDTAVKLSEVNEITNKHNPVDIYELARTKIKQKKYDDAAVAFLIAFSYGKYDTFRVEDETAHQAVIVLGERAFSDMSHKQKNKFLKAVDLLIQNKERVLSLLNRVGKPDYYPKYMIQHGMGAFVGNKSKDGLIPGFDPEKAWEMTLIEIFPVEENSKK